MGTETILASVGGLLILVAGIGGGFEVKSAKIPKVSVGGRIVSLVMGVACLGLAVVMSFAEDELTEEELADEMAEEEMAEDEPVRQGQVVQDTQGPLSPPKAPPKPPKSGPPRPPGL